MEKKIAGALIGLLASWLIEAAIQEALRQLGVPKHATKVIGTVLGAALT
jgi:hypothetical protein